MKKENLLASWKEIASYLDRDISTCRRWEKTHGLPVYRIDEKSKSSVFAYKDEIDKWLEERLKKESRQRNFFLGIKWQKSFYFIFPIIAVILIILFIVLPYDSQPVDFKIENSNLIILNKKGKELWRYDTEIENLVDEKSYREHFQFKRMPESNPSLDKYLPQLIIKDINQDERPEVLFSIQTQDEFGEGKLFCFNQKGTILWDFKGGRDIKFGPKVYSSDYRIRGFMACDLDNDGYLETVIVSQHKYYYPTQLVVLEYQGNILGEYWNSGQFSDFTFVDLNDDGRKEIILSAMNNEYKKGCLIVLDSADIRGGSHQLNDFYKCKDLERGSEKYYILFPRTDVGLINILYDSMSWIDILGNRRISVLSYICRISFEFNYNIELQDVRLSHTFELLHQMALEEGKIKKELNRAEYRKSLAQGLLYYDGEKWVNHYAMSNPWNSPEK